MTGRRNIWTLADDQRLREIVLEMGAKNWKEIAKWFGNGRTWKQCSDRWHGYLKVGLDSSRAWTAEEDAILMKELHMLGPKWSLIALSLPGRSRLAVKNRCYSKDRELRSKFVSVSVEKAKVPATTITSPFLDTFAHAVYVAKRRRVIEVSPPVFVDSILDEFGDVNVGLDIDLNFDF